MASLRRVEGKSPFRRLSMRADDCEVVYHGGRLV